MREKVVKMSQATRTSSAIPVAATRGERIEKDRTIQKAEMRIQVAKKRAKEAERAKLTAEREKDTAEDRWQKAEIQRKVYVRQHPHPT